MTIPNLTEARLHRQATSKSFERGEDYYKSGAVVSVTQRGQVIQATVEGNEAHPYLITLQADSGGITTANCTCEYNFEGWCKHIVATLLTCIRQPDQIEARPTPNQILDRLDLIQLRGLLQQLMSDRPELIDAIDLLVSQQTAAPEKYPQRQTTVDPAPFRRKVNDILRNAVNAWENGYDDEDPVIDELSELIDKAQNFSRQGDGHNALIILESITDAIIGNWEDASDYGLDNENITEVLDYAWTEAILTVSTSPAEQNRLKQNLEGWQDLLDGNLEMSLEALRQGWDYPPLQRVFQGAITKFGVWEGEAPYYADDLADIRLQILDRQDRDQEYLYLAQAEGRTQSYLTMLGRLGRVAEAMTEASTQMTSMAEAFALAKVLREQGQLPQALEIAHQGLSLSVDRGYDFTTWTSDLAEGLGNLAVALEARIAAFGFTPSLNDYCKVKELAGAEWPTVKVLLLEKLKETQSWGDNGAKVDIYLEEGLIKDAIATVQGLNYYYADLIHRVMDVAIHQNPEWVINNACVRAEDIINRGKADAYHHAANWLRKVRAAYLASDQKSGWAKYRAQLIQTHNRKYKLMGLLQQGELV